MFVRSQRKGAVNCYLKGLLAFIYVSFILKGKFIWVNNTIWNDKKGISQHQKNMQKKIEELVKVTIPVKDPWIFDFMGNHKIMFFELCYKLGEKWVVHKFERNIKLPFHIKMPGVKIDLVIFFLLRSNAWKSEISKKVCRFYRVLQ